MSLSPSCVAGTKAAQAAGVVERQLSDLSETIWANSGRVLSVPARAWRAKPC